MNETEILETMGSPFSFMDNSHLVIHIALQTVIYPRLLSYP